MNAATINQMIRFRRNLISWCFTKILWMGYRFVVGYGSVLGHWWYKYNSLLL